MKGRGNFTIRQPVKKGVAKVPVVMQMEFLECGAACLSMVMAYYGKWISLEQAREDCGVSRDGSKAGNIARAARSYGFNAQGYRFEPEELKKNGTFPCVIHWEFNHFVVLCGFKGDKVYINDPGCGTIVLTMKDFDEKVITFFPDYQVKRGEKTIYDVTIRHLLTMTAPYKGKSEPWKLLLVYRYWRES